MNLMKKTALLLLMCIGASTVSQSIHADAGVGATAFGGLSNWSQNFKFEIQPYNVIDLIRKYPVTAFSMGILAMVGIMKLQRYWYYELPNKIEEIRDALKQEMYINNIGKEPKKDFLTKATHCCNPLQYVYFMKSKVSLAELVGGPRLVKLIEKFYEAKKNWKADAPNSVSEAKAVKKQISLFLNGSDYVD